MFFVFRFIIYFSLVSCVHLLQNCSTCPKFDIYFCTKQYQQICLRHECHDLNKLQTRIKTIKDVDDEDMANNSGLNGLYRPRSALARALYEKQRNDRQLQEFDQNEVRICNT